MNLIETLKKADGKPVRRAMWDTFSWTIPNYRIVGKQVKKDTSEDSRISSHVDDLLADDWYVVEPKSKIEEAIERECLGVLNQSFHQDAIRKILSRVANAVIDEAIALEKRASESGWGYSLCIQHLEALKLKE